MSNLVDALSLVVSRRILSAMRLFLAALLTVASAHVTLAGKPLPLCNDVDYPDDVVDRAVARVHEKMKKAGKPVSDMDSPYFTEMLRMLGAELGCRYPTNDEQSPPTNGGSGKPAQ